MSKKALILGLFVVLTAPLFGGVFSTQAQSAYYPQPYGLYCTPSTQSANSGQRVNFSAYYAYDYGFAPQSQLTWTAVGGRPSSGTGTSFETRFTTSSINETRVITVTDGFATATCTVYVYGPQPTWTPTPTPVSTLQCSPAYSNANSGDSVSFSAWGGNGSYSWRATEGFPDSGRASTFSTRFYNYSNSSVTNTVSVKSANQTAYCTVYVYGQSTWTPTPTPTYNWVSFDHTVRNLTRGGSGTSVTARNGDRLQFVATITTGPQYSDDVHIRDWLPQYVNYAYGSTTVDGARYQDGIATGNNNSSLALGTLAPNRAYVVRFEATINGAPNMTLTNSVNVHVRGLADQNDTSTVRVTGTSATPTPYATPTWTPTPTPAVGSLVLSIAGRNITRGQTGENATVNARAVNTVEFVLHVRSGSYLNNVYVTDYIPAGMTYIKNSTVLNGYIVADGITSSGLNIGSLAAGQEAVIRFSVLVDGSAVPSLGQVTVSNTAQARADGVTLVSATMKVTFGQAPLASAYGVATGPADSLLLALAAAALATGIYAGYTRTGSFKRSMAVKEIGRISGSTPNFL